ncbi:MAG: hypothetical protein HY696_06335 [Deltaproteobacteria bacterium]|nr:hypothetical protein [Deltaproteobacteria bacterium]
MSNISVRIPLEVHGRFHQWLQTHDQRPPQTTIELMMGHPASRQRPQRWHSAPFHGYQRGVRFARHLGFRPDATTDLRGFSDRAGVVMVAAKDNRNAQQPTWYVGTEVEGSLELYQLHTTPRIDAERLCTEASLFSYWPIPYRQDGHETSTLDRLPQSLCTHMRWQLHDAAAGQAPQSQRQLFSGGPFAPLESCTASLQLARAIVHAPLSSRNWFSSHERTIYYTAMILSAALIAKQVTDNQILGVLTGVGSFAAGYFGRHWQLQRHNKQSNHEPRAQLIAAYLQTHGTTYCRKMLKALHEAHPSIGYREWADTMQWMYQQQRLEATLGQELVYIEPAAQPRFDGLIAMGVRLRAVPTHSSESRRHLTILEQATATAQPAGAR